MSCDWIVLRLCEGLAIDSRERERERGDLRFTFPNEPVPSVAVHEDE